VPWIIKGYDFILRGSEVVSNLLEITYKFCKKINALSEPPDGWPETGVQRRGSRLAFLVSRICGIY
jgi:hypothetical protein